MYTLKAEYPISFLALPKDLLNNLELSQKSDQGKVDVKSDKKSKHDVHQINNNTTNNYYITSERKKSRQIDPTDLGQIRSNTCSIKIPCIKMCSPRIFRPSASPARSFKFESM